MKMASTNIKLERTRLDATQEEFANLVGVSRRTVIEWEKGRTDNIPASTLLRMSSICGCSIDYLLGISSSK